MADTEIETLDDVQDALASVKGEIAKRIVGQREVIDQVLACVLADGNALLESNPGLGKTLLVRTLADTMDLQFSRIQNTPDLMPSDVIGTEMVRETEAGMEFVFERGPVFANVVLADEINRATPKTQSALLEAMQERQVTAGGETRALPDPFFLLATQNPIDMEGSLHPEESLYMNGQLWTAADALDHARTEGELVHESDRTRLYDVGATTQTLTPGGELVETDCMVYETDYEGEIYALETKTGRSIRVSDNHPFLVNRAGAIRWVEAAELERGDALVSPRRLVLPERPFVSHGEALDALEREGGYTVVRRDRVRSLRRKLDRRGALGAEEVDALRIAAGLSKKELAAAAGASYDRVLNFLRGTENGVGERLRSTLRSREIGVGDYVEAHTIHRIDGALTDGEAGFLVGFILAEGAVSGDAISVSQKNLPGKLDCWVDIAERVGLDVTIRERPTGREAKISSKPFVDYLDERFHLTAPERVLSAPEAFRESFLEIFLLTGSHYDSERRRITFVQKDRTMTNVIAHLLLDAGIVPWVYEREDRYELRIQGEDVGRYVERFEWRGREPDVTDFESVHRTTPLPDETVTRLVEVLGMKYEESLSSREWYNSYRRLRAEGGRMATANARHLVDDIEGTLDRRRGVDIERAVEDDIGDAAKLCGLSMTDIAEETGLSKDCVWRAYRSEERPEDVVEYVVSEYGERMAEAEALTEYLRGLLDGDVFYDPITSIETEPYQGPVIGLSVPEHHNYVAGLGACGISHNTYPLPEAQTDRFMLKVLVEFPSFDEEREIVDRYTRRDGGPIPVERVLEREDLIEIQGLTREVPMADDLLDDAVELVQRTREADDIEFGASPRASLSLVLASKARALLRGRAHVSREDVEAMALPVLRHRIVLDFRTEREGRTPDDVIGDLL